MKTAHFEAIFDVHIVFDEEFTEADLEHPGRFSPISFDMARIFKSTGHCVDGQDPMY